MANRSGQERGGIGSKIKRFFGIEEDYVGEAPVSEGYETESPRRSTYVPSRPSGRNSGSSTVIPPRSTSRGQGPRTYENGKLKTPPQPARPTRPERKRAVEDEPSRFEPQRTRAPRGDAGVTATNLPARRRSSGAMANATLYELRECRDVITQMVRGVSIIVNMEAMDSLNFDRAKDTLCGATLALNGSMVRITPRIFMMLPPGANMEEMMGRDYE
ncbi:MAG: cell division protein SepF [Clostridia bacterium]|nr:cell division protein SepF [Clostridia bacterium]